MNHSKKQTSEINIYPQDSVYSIQHLSTENPQALMLCVHSVKQHSDCNKQR